MMIDLNTKDSKLSSYITSSTIEHFRLYLNNKDLVNDKKVCFFCLKSISKDKKLNVHEFGFIEQFDYDFQFLTKLADSMGHEYSEEEFIPRYIRSCAECKELINDPDRLFYLEEDNYEPEEKKSNLGVWVAVLFLFRLARYFALNFPGGTL